MPSDSTPKTNGFSVYCLPPRKTVPAKKTGQKKARGRMPRAWSTQRKSLYLLLPNQHLPSGREITSRQQVEIDAARNRLAECGASIPIRGAAPIGVIAHSLMTQIQSTHDCKINPPVGAVSNRFVSASPVRLGNRTYRRLIVVPYFKITIFRKRDLLSAWELIEIDAH